MSTDARCMSTNVWEDDPISGAMRTVRVQQVVAISGVTLLHAARNLAKTPSAKNLKIKSGEHLAGIVLSAFGGQIISMDRDGGFDFVLLDSANSLFEEHDSAAVEVKSAAGEWRARWSRRDYVHEIVVEDYLEVLRDQSSPVNRAMRQIARKMKAGPRRSRGVFLLIHYLDRLASPGPLDQPGVLFNLPLPIPRSSLELDGLWLLFHPNVVSRWSQLQRCWTHYVIASDMDHEIEDADMAVAEKAFIAEVCDEREGFEWFVWF